MSWNVSPLSKLTSSTPPSKPSWKLKLFRKYTRMEPPVIGRVGDRSCLSLIVAGSSTNAAFGSVSAGGLGTPESDVTHVVLDQPGGSAGGVTLSNNSAKTITGSHCCACN